MDPADLQDLDGWQALGCAILARAFDDAVCTNGHKAAQELGLPPGVGLADDARHFLAGDGARLLWSLLDLDPGEFDRRLAAVPLGRQSRGRRRPGQGHRRAQDRL